MDITRNILRTEGTRGLYRGLTTTLLRECPGYGFFFGGYELTRSLLIKENEKKTDIGKRSSIMNNLLFNPFFPIGFVRTWISGGMAGICFWIFMFPIDAIKSRVQVFKPNMNTMQYTLHIVRNEGKSWDLLGMFL